MFSSITLKKGLAIFIQVAPINPLDFLFESFPDSPALFVEFSPHPIKIMVISNVNRGLMNLFILVRLCLHLYLSVRAAYMTNKKRL